MNIISSLWPMAFRLVDWSFGLQGFRLQRFYCTANVLLIIKIFQNLLYGVKQSETLEV